MSVLEVESKSNPWSGAILSSCRKLSQATAFTIAPATDNQAVKKEGRLGLTFERADGVSTSILQSGTMITQIPPNFHGDPKQVIRDVYRTIFIQGLGLQDQIPPEI